MTRFGVVYLRVDMTVGAFSREVDQARADTVALLIQPLSFSLNLTERVSRD